MSKKLLLPSLYLSALESQFDLSLGNPVPKQLKPFAQTISEMSAGLKKNRKRDVFVSKTYLDDKKYCDAYLLYYTTCNLLKMYYPLGELKKSEFFKGNSALCVLDLGSGTGTMIISLSSWLAENFPSSRTHFTAWDQSSVALQTLEKFYERFDWKYELETHPMDIENIRLTDQRYNLITGGNVLNELTKNGEEQFINILERNLLPDGFVILIEPALKNSSRRLLELRDRLLQSGWVMYAPCFTHNSCPALANPEDWCHHDMPWERPKFIEILDEMVGHIRKSLKFSYLILSRRNIHLSEFIAPKRNFTNQFRVVSDLFKEKGRRRIFLCNDLGRIECLKNKRDNSEKNGAFDDLELYDIVQIDSLSEKKEVKKIEKEITVAKIE
ncbi:class I SAM-dependent methyltransferase [bacterium]|nr:MAG: class I SAM-dependent methyltransferase [bacterium]